MKHMTRKATRHISQNEGLIFEKSSPGKAAWKLPPLDVPDVDTNKLLGAAERKDLGSMPEVSELDLQLEDGRVTAYRAKIKVSFKYEGGD